MQNLTTNKTLIERIQDNKSDSDWDEFHQIYSRYLYIVIRNMNVSAEDAEDILQETLVKIWAGLPNFEYKPGKHRFRSWLCTVARNTLRNFVQKNQNSDFDLIQKKFVKESRELIGDYKMPYEFSHYKAIFRKAFHAIIGHDSKN